MSNVAEYNLVEKWSAAPPLTPLAAIEKEQWYAVQTRAQHEKLVANRFEARGITTFLPMRTEVHRWSDRKKIVQLPLFNCYVFAKIMPTSVDRLRVLRVNGVLNLVGTRGEGTPIPDDQIESIRILLKEQVEWSAHPFLRAGQRVRIRSGALDGMEGVLVSTSGDRTLVVSINAIQRSLAVRLEGYEVEAA